MTTFVVIAAAIFHWFFALHWQPISFATLKLLKSENSFSGVG
jgi:hypothetical protein